MCAANAAILELSSRCIIPNDAYYSGAYRNMATLGQLILIARPRIFDCL
jgi:hypothetical protein